MKILSSLLIVFTLILSLESNAGTTVDIGGDGTERYIKTSGCAELNNYCVGHRVVKDGTYHGSQYKYDGPIYGTIVGIQYDHSDKVAVKWDDATGPNELSAYTTSDLAISNNQCLQNKFCVGRNVSFLGYDLAYGYFNNGIMLGVFPGRGSVLIDLGSGAKTDRIRRLQVDDLKTGDFRQVICKYNISLEQRAAFYNLANKHEGFKNFEKFRDKIHSDYSGCGRGGDWVSIGRLKDQALGTRLLGYAIGGSANSELGYISDSYTSDDCVRENKVAFATGTAEIANEKSLLNKDLTEIATRLGVSYWFWQSWIDVAKDVVDDCLSPISP